jgi:hypothetical protein
LTNLGAKRKGQEKAKTAAESQNDADKKKAADALREKETDEKAKKAAKAAVKEK